jgi:hypothetical protein
MPQQRWSTSKMIEAALDRAALERLEHAVKQFDTVIWKPWLQAYYRETKHRGHKAVFDGVTLLVWGTAARVLMTLQRDDCDVALIAAEFEDSRLGLQGIAATPEEAVRLIEFVTMRASHFRSLLAPDTEVRLAGL